MKLFEIQKIDKLCFGHEEIARVLGISEASSRVTASRYAKKGLLLRIKKNMYVLREKWILRSSWVLSLTVTLVSIMPPTDSATSKKN